MASLLLLGFGIEVILSLFDIFFGVLSIEVILSLLNAFFGVLSIEVNLSVTNVFLGELSMCCFALGLAVATTTAAVRGDPADSNLRGDPADSNRGREVKTFRGGDTLLCQDAGTDGVCVPRDPPKESLGTLGVEEPLPP